MGLLLLIHAGNRALAPDTMQHVDFVSYAAAAEAQRLAEACGLDLVCLQRHKDSFTGGGTS